MAEEKRRTSELPLIPFPSASTTLVGVEEGETVQIPIDHVIRTIHSELKILRDCGELIPGMFYRITDYECTTAQEGTRAMNHRFDIIVQALSRDRLSEIAKADFNDEDSYFADNGANLAAWEIKYCLDNDVTRFAWCSQCITNLQSGFSQLGDVLVRCPDFDWASGQDDYVYAWGTEADAEDGDICNFIYSKAPIICDNEGVWHSPSETVLPVAVKNMGKGVIYYMKDEHGNECSYDFKNIQFLKWISHDDECPYYDEECGDEDWCYTFCGNQYNADDDEWSYLLDGSIGSHFVGRGTRVDDMYSFHSNVIKPQRYDDNYYESRFRLNGIVLFGKWEVNRDRVAWSDCCYDNVFDDDCLNITLCAGCFMNHFDKWCHDINLGITSCNNQFSVGCCYIYTADSLENSSFGINCYEIRMQGGWDNIFGRSCGDTTFEEWCHDITIGRYCYGNTFGPNVGNITLGDYCEENTFGGDENTIILEHHCCNNSLEDSGIHNVQLRPYIHDHRVLYPMSGDENGLIIYTHTGIHEQDVQL